MQPEIPHIPGCAFVAEVPLELQPLISSLMGEITRLRAVMRAEHELRAYYQNIVANVHEVLDRPEAQDLNDMLDEIEFWVLPGEYIGGYRV